MKTKIIALLLSVTPLWAGDTYDCIRARGDYVNYGAPLVHNTEIIVAVDAARHEQRWHAMLDDEDLKALIFIGARHTQVLEVYQ